MKFFFAIINITKYLQNLYFIFLKTKDLKNNTVFLQFFIASAIKKFRWERVREREIEIERERQTERETEIERVSEGSKRERKRETERGKERE